MMIRPQVSPPYPTAATCMRVILASAVVVAGCGAAPSENSASSDEAISSADVATSSVTPVSGLMMRDGVPPYAKGEETFMTSSVIALDWDSLEHVEGTFTWGPLQDAVQALQAAHISDIKLRIYSGGSAPPWAKRLGSAKGFFNSPYGISIDCGDKSHADWGGVAVQNIQGPQACVPFFWTTEYQAAYGDLMQALATEIAKSTYAPITTIVDSSCMAVYAEVFYRGQSDGATNHTLAEATSLIGGLTPDLDWKCQEAAIETHKAAFGTKWRTALAINDWDLVQTSPEGKGDTYRIASWSKAESGQPGTLDFLEQVAIPRLGSSLELQNNGLHTNSDCSGSADSSYFCYLASYAGRRGFQTQTYVPNPSGGASETLLEDLDNGLAMHADFIELPDGMNDDDWKLMSCYQEAILAGAGKGACPK
jgi:hypothetical protein